MHKSCRSRKNLQNEYLVAGIGFETAENEPSNLFCKGRTPYRSNALKKCPGGAKLPRGRPRPRVGLPAVDLEGAAARPLRARRRSVGKISAKCCSFSAVSAPIFARKYAFCTESAAFFKIYQILKMKFLNFDKILQILRHLQFFAEISRKLLFFQTDFLRKF